MSLENRLKYYLKQKSRFCVLILKYEYLKKDTRFIDTINRQIAWNNTYIKRITRTIIKQNKKP